MKKNYIDLVPRDNTENIRWHNVFDVLADACNAGRGTGELNAAERQQISSVEFTPERASINAQAVLAVNRENAYARIPETFINSAKMASNNGNPQNNLHSENKLIIAPNPFTEETTINYNLSSEPTSAEIFIIDITGRIIKEYKLNNDLQGTISFKADNSRGGIYFCQLFLNGTLNDIKKIVLVK